LFNHFELAMLVLDVLWNKVRNCTRDLGTYSVEDIGRCSTPDRQSWSYNNTNSCDFSYHCLTSKFYELAPMIDSTKNK